MYVCVCRAITEQDIHAAALNGASSMKDLREQLGLGEECGSCGSYAKQCLREANRQINANTATPLFYAAA